MLYDNALLLGVLSEAFQLTGQERTWRVIRETLEFVRGNDRYFRRVLFCPGCRQ